MAPTEFSDIFSSGDSTIGQITRNALLPPPFYMVIHHLEQERNIGIRIVPTNDMPGVASIGALSKSNYYIFLPQSICTQNEQTSLDSQSALLLRCLLVAHELAHLMLRHDAEMAYLWQNQLGEPKEFHDLLETEAEAVAFALLHHSQVDIFSDGAVRRLLRHLPLSDRQHNLLKAFEIYLRESGRLSFLSTCETLSSDQLTELVWHSERLSTLLTILYALDFDSDQRVTSDFLGKIQIRSFPRILSLEKVSYASPAWLVWLMDKGKVIPGALREGGKLARDVIPSIIALPQHVRLAWKKTGRQIEEEEAKTEQARVKKMHARTAQAKEVTAFLDELGKIEDRTGLKGILVRRGLETSPVTRQLLESSRALSEMKVITRESGQNQPSEGTR